MQSAEAKENPYVAVVARKQRNLKKKLERIVKVEESVTKGKVLDEEQRVLLHSKKAVEKSLADLSSIRQALEEVAQEIEKTNENTVTVETPAAEEKNGAETPVQPPVVEEAPVVAAPTVDPAAVKAQLEESVALLLKALHVYRRYKDVTNKDLPDNVEYFGQTLLGTTSITAFSATLKSSLREANSYLQDDVANEKKITSGMTYFELRKLVDQLADEMEVAPHNTAPHNVILRYQASTVTAPAPRAEPELVVQPPAAPAFENSLYQRSYQPGLGFGDSTYNHDIMGGFGGLQNTPGLFYNSLGAAPQPTLSPFPAAVEPVSVVAPVAPSVVPEPVVVSEAVAPVAAPVAEGAKADKEKKPKRERAPRAPRPPREPATAPASAEVPSSAVTEKKEGAEEKAPREKKTFEKKPRPPRKEKVATEAGAAPVSPAAPAVVAAPEIVAPAPAAAPAAAVATTEEKTEEKKETTDKKKKIRELKNKKDLADKPKKPVAEKPATEEAPATPAAAPVVESAVAPVAESVAAPKKEAVAAAPVAAEPAAPEGPKKPMTYSALFKPAAPEPAPVEAAHAKEGKKVEKKPKSDKPKPERKPREDRPKKAAAETAATSSETAAPEAAAAAVTEAAPATAEVKTSAPETSATAGKDAKPQRPRKTPSDRPPFNKGERPAHKGPRESHTAPAAPRSAPEVVEDDGFTMVKHKNREEKTKTAAPASGSAPRNPPKTFAKGAAPSKPKSGDK